MTYDDITVHGTVAPGFEGVRDASPPCSPIRPVGRRTGTHAVGTPS
ncbi:hypothetical protein ACFU6I_01005 [Streptomyces sp. NPDC057486]